jgi:hypothetical protein
VSLARQLNISTEDARIIPLAEDAALFRATLAEQPYLESDGLYVIAVKPAGAVNAYQ